METASSKQPLAVLAEMDRIAAAYEANTADSAANLDPESLYRAAVAHLSGRA